MIGCLIEAIREMMENWIDRCVCVYEYPIVSIETELMV